MQGEILKILEKQKEPIGRTEIARLLNTTPIKVSIGIKRLLKFKEIRCIELSRDQAMEHYNCKRRMRLYYCTKI